MGLSAWSRGKKLQTPGPGRYDVPSHFGDGPQFTFKGRVKTKDPEPEPPLRSIPSALNTKGATFGYSAPKVKEFITPTSYLSHQNFGEDAPKYSFRFRRKEHVINNPGPADYTIDRSILKGPPQTIGYGPRTKVSSNDITVGPADSNVPSMFPMYKPQTIGSKIPEKEHNKYGPGPSKYNTRSELGKDARKSKITGVHCAYDISSNPSPAEYSIDRNISNSSRIKITIKGRSSKSPWQTHDKKDYPYYKIPGSLKSQKISMGIRPETSYETCSPGPYIKHKSTLSNIGSTIGIKEDFPNTMSYTPGPGTYFKIPPQPMRESINGLGGGGNRSIINEKESKSLPGSGDYHPARVLDRFERGFYFTSRTMNNFQADTSAPYYEAKSTLGGPKWTIGNKESC